MALERETQDRLIDLGFEEVYEIVPGALYELVANMRKYRMVIARAVISPIFVTVTFDQQVTVASGQDIFEEGFPTPLELWSEVPGCVATLGSNEAAYTTDYVVAYAAMCLAQHLRLEGASS